MIVRVLLVVDGVGERRRLARLVTDPGVDSESLTARESLWERLSRGDHDLVIIDRSRIKDPVESFVATVRDRPDRPEVIVLTDAEDATDRAALIAAGCFAVLLRSLRDSALRETLRALIDRSREQAMRRLRTERPDERYRLDDFVSLSPAMQAFMVLPRRVASSDSSVLVLGETGVGKERLARSLHGESHRSGGPFLAVNCGALSESLLESELFGHEEGAFTGASRTRKGFFELAHRGTLFLDEVGEMPIHVQVKLLRALEERTVRRVGGERPVAVDVRIMAASNRDLEAETKAKRFRPDLYFRLAVVTLHIPPLRERREDIPRLVEDSLIRARFQTNRPVDSISDDALEALARYDWPGNVRELINVIEQSCLLSAGHRIGVGDLPGRISGHAPRPRRSDTGDGLLDLPLPEARRLWSRRFERQYVEQVLVAARGRVGDAARRAGISPRSLHDLMVRHGFHKEDYRS